MGLDEKNDHKETNKMRRKETTKYLYLVFGQFGHVVHAHTENVAEIIYLYLYTK